MSPAARPKTPDTPDAIYMRAGDVIHRFGPDLGDLAGSGVNPDLEVRFRRASRHGEEVWLLELPRVWSGEPGLSYPGFHKLGPDDPRAFSHWQEAGGLHTLPIWELHAPS